MHQVEIAASSVIIREICDTVISAADAKRHRTAGKPVCQFRKPGNRRVDDQRALRGDFFGKQPERMADIVQIFEKVEMIRVNI